VEETALQINVSTRHGHLSAAAQEKITAKVSKIERFYDRITAINVTVDLRDESSPKVELRVSAELANDMVAADTRDKLMPAVDAVIHKIEHQLKRHKEKLTDHRNDGRRSSVEGSDEELASDDE
jgi:putative sigma-54 modulation protein